MRYRFLSMAGGAALLLTAGAVTVHADQGDNKGGDQQYGDHHGGDGWKKDWGDDSDPKVNATPELDSIALFGTGAAGMAGYAVMRLRAARRKDGTVEDR